MCSLFEPISHNLPVRQIADRLINQIAGKVWVDAQEFEVAGQRSLSNLRSTSGAACWVC